MATGLLSVLVVLGMVAAAVITRESGDLHRRAGVLVEQIRASSEEMSAFKWQANTKVLEGTADFSLSGPLVRSGTRITSQLSAEVAQLQRLRPGADAERLEGDVQQLYAGELQELPVARSSRLRQSLEAMQSGFQPVLDRLDADAQRMATHEQAVAAGALVVSLWASIGSLLLGVGVLSVLGWRTGRLRRRSELAGEVRAVERRSEQRIRALVEHSSDVVTVLDHDLRVRWQAASAHVLLGVAPKSLINAPICSIVHPDDQGLFEGFLRARVQDRGPSTVCARLRHADGRWFDVETVAESQLADPAIAGLVLNMRDISERKALEDELRRQSFHDALTGLANWALFENRLSHALAGRLRTQRPLAVLFLDLDDFKTINDSLDHRIGDRLLQSVAGRIDALLRPTDTAARLGGDEFAVLADGVESIAEAHSIAARILRTLIEPFVIEEAELSVTASIGIALSDGSVDSDELLRNADMAMYAAKASGKNSIDAFEQAMHQRAIDRLELRSELQRALACREFELDYQPIVSLQGGQIVAVEALVRWAHPTRGRLAPDQFIALTEETGQIVPLGAWVLEHACAQVRQWELALHNTHALHVCVNVSTRQLAEDDFPATVAAILARTDLDPQSLVLEITEGMLADDRDAVVRRLQALKRLGLQIAVDDFGTGYSALAHLQQFPIDILKIDKSFVDNLHTDGQQANLVQGIINLGESLHLDVVAEGIEHLNRPTSSRRCARRSGRDTSSPALSAPTGSLRSYNTDTASCQAPPPCNAGSSY